ncbi:helix-turn-helix domain-containing protein [Siminovitchia sp. 179-K 8D1 HS]|uniref:helix-turn-helix domain-containing protein n=1 Tax=Siminovitchia sp. 179-K 8D1 HS TaxID=3142385 RepID=UPI0039A11268
MAFHEELKKYRVEILKLSQEEAIRRLHISQTALSFYETGKRQMTIDTLKDFKRAYSIPDDHLMRMVFGDQTGKEYPPLILREQAREADLQRVIEMLQKNTKMLNALVNLSYASEKTQKAFTDLLPHLLKFNEKQ